MSAVFNRRTLSVARVCALTATLTGHILLVAQLWLSTEVVPQVQAREALDVHVYLDAETLPTPPPRPPPPPAPPGAGGGPAPASPLQRSPANVAAPAATIATPTPETAPSAPATWAEPLDPQRAAVAAAIARENAPKRRAFQGRSLDAMLPGGDNGKLPGFRPRTSDDNRDALRRLGQMLSHGLSSAAVDPDAPMDPLTEAWEAASHGSDLADCERKYQELDQDLRLQLCGEVRPPQ